jgi:hypothetical protein
VKCKLSFDVRSAGNRHATVLWEPGAFIAPGGGVGPSAASK